MDRCKECGCEMNEADAQRSLLELLDHAPDGARRAAPSFRQWLYKTGPLCPKCLQNFLKRKENAN